MYRTENLVQKLLEKRTGTMTLASIHHCVTVWLLWSLITGGTCVISDVPDFKECKLNDLILEFVESFVETHFPWTLINIVYNGPEIGRCGRIEEAFLHHSTTLRSALTVVKKLPGQKLQKWNFRNESYMEGNCHFHQLSSWKELNVVFVTSLEKLNELVESPVFKRANTYSFFLAHKLRLTTSMDSVLELPVLNKLKYKVDVGVSIETYELIIESVCFFCDAGDPAVVQVYRQPLQTLKTQTLPSKETIFKDYTRDFNGKILQVSLSKGIPAMMNYKTLKNGRIVASGGFQTSLFHLVRRKLNFSYKLHLESAFGLEGPNGTYSGMVGSVQSGLTDLGVGAAVTFGRHKVVHYLTPNTFHIVTFITRSSIFLPEWQTMFLAFTAPLWFTLFLITLFIMLPVYIIVSVFGPRNGDNDSSKLLSIVMRGIGFIFRPLMDQHRTLSANDSVKILSGFWLFSVLVIGAEFRSNLMKLFLSPPLEHLPTTFTQLANSDYDIYTHYARGSLEEIVRSTHTKTFDRITERMHLEESIRNCLNNTLKKKAACISYEDDAIIEGQKYFSDPYGHLFIHRAPVAAFNFFASIILPKEAVYIDVMEMTVSQIVDMGITKRFHDEQFQTTKRRGMSFARKHKSGLPTYYDSHHHYAKLTLGHFSGAFVILLFGLIVATCVWLVEQREVNYLKEAIERFCQFSVAVPVPTVCLCLCPSNVSTVSPLVHDVLQDDDETPRELLSD